MNQLVEEEKLMQHFLEQCLCKKLAFYAYSLPESQEICVGIQTAEHGKKYKQLSTLKEKEGFVFAPFDVNGKHQSHFIQADLILNSGSSEYPDLSKYPDTETLADGSFFESSQADYDEQIGQMLDALRANQLNKAILSRIHVHKGKGRKDAAALFLKLNKTYPSAFVSMVDIPGLGLWIGASPERLLVSNGESIETVALAGTQKLDGRKIQSVQWEQKEIEEQAYVSDYIEELLRNFEIKNYSKKGPYTAQAGFVVHLKTSYRVDEDLNFEQIANIVQALHPTPAVCGLPKQKAMDLIRKVEQHDREYYAGYLGPVHANGKLSLFVNLRSMKVLQDKLCLYVGGGITADSEPEKEWDETCFKAQTLLNVIK
jgi:isochorismate synthase